MTAPFRGSSSGLSRKRLRGPAYRRIGHDLYVVREADVDLAARVASARLIYPDAVVCLFTAGALLRLPVDDDGIVHLDRGTAASRSRRAGIKVHRYGIPSGRIHDVNGIKVADGPRIFADLSEHFELEALVALGDVVARRWKAEEIAEAVADHGSRPGAVLLRQAVPLLDKGADSPAETRARLRLHAAGFTRMQHKVVVRDVGGGWLGEPDLADEVAMVGVQHEGKVHFEKGERQRMKDVGRDEVMREEDWQIVISTAADDRRPDKLIAKVTAAYRRQARLLGPQVLPEVLR
ncbi:MAG: hypothetical protein ABR549_13230 [Mycobacteriales bacterium]